MTRFSILRVKSVVHVVPMIHGQIHIHVTAFNSEEHTVQPPVLEPMWFGTHMSACDIIKMRRQYRLLGVAAVYSNGRHSYIKWKYQPYYEVKK